MAEGIEPVRAAAEFVDTLFADLETDARVVAESVLVSQVGIAGSTRLGDYVVLGGQVGLADHVNIGSGTQIAAQSGVMSDIGPGEVMMGYPAVPIKQFMRQTAFIQKAVKK